MRCPFCGFEDTQVKDSRATDEGVVIRRRRYCPKCDSRFTTFERVQLRELMVIKRNGEKRPFDRDKLARSIMIAARKRPISEEKIESIVNRIVRNLEASGEQEIPSDRIGQEVMNVLAEADKVAYIRFASVYKDFRELKDFEDFVDKIER